MQARLLHLTDLHLGTHNPDEWVDDIKVEVVEYERRLSRRALIGSTLHELARDLRTRDEKLDAVVISGDITYAGDPDGMQELEEVLSQLGDRRPDARRIVVVPGNHDVKWKTASDSVERYAAFREHICDRDYIYPPLESDATLDQTRNLLVDHDAGLLVVPVNSANWCGVLEDLSDRDRAKLVDAFVDADAENGVGSVLERLRLHDMPRVERNHLAQFRDAMESLDPTHHLTRVAVVHHQLGPVSTTEELKPFETMTNLGLFRSFLRANGFFDRSTRP